MIPPAASEIYDEKGVDALSCCNKHIRSLSLGAGITLICQKNSNVKDILGVYGLKDGVMLHVTPHNKDEDSYSASLPRVQTTTSVAEMEGLRIEVEKLRAENAVLTRKLEEKSSQLECTVCMENDRNVVFAKCHHLVVCGGCAEELKECPVCRGEVKEKSMDVYWS